MRSGGCHACSCEETLLSAATPTQPSGAPGFRVCAVLALAYAGLGFLCAPLFVATGPVAFFLAPAGLGLIALRHYGPRCAPGIFVGALLFRWLAPEGGGGVGAVAALGLAAAALVEAVVVARVLKRTLGADEITAGPGQAFGFGLALCLAASLGAGLCVLVLVASGESAASDAATLFGVAMLGDLLGMFVVAPLGLALLRQPPSSRWGFVSVSGAPVLCAVVGAVLVFLWQVDHEHELSVAELGQRSARLAQGVRSNITETRLAVAGLEALYAASREVDRDEFAAFARRTLESHLEIRTLEWVPRVPAAERERFEASVRAQGFPEFTIRELRDGELVAASQRPEYFPVDFIHPEAGNERARGLDLGSSEIRQASLARARDRAEPVVTERLVLIQDPDAAQWASLLVLPIYRNGAPTTSVEERRAALSGFVVAVLQLDDLMRHALQGLDASGFRLRVLDLSAQAESRELWSDRGEAPRTDLAWLHALDLGGRRWALETVLTDAGALAVAPRWGWLAVALGATGLLEMLLLSMTQRTERVEGVVETRTEQLSRAVEAAEAAARARTQFLSSMGQEIRRPVNAILGQAALLTRPGLDEAELHATVSHVQEGCQRLLRVLEDVIDLSRVEAGHMRLDRVPTSIGRVVHEAVARHAEAARSRGLRCEAEFCPRLPARIGSDPLRLRQILDNLIGQALEATPDGRVVVRVDLDSADPDDLWLSIAVRDGGPDLAPEQIARVFEGFQSDDPGLQRRFATTGLGLRISKRIANLLGGTIEVSSKADRGTTFTLRLPIGSRTTLRMVDSAEAIEAPAALLPAEDTANLDLRILVADDNQVNQRLLARMLEASGAQVETAANGAEAVERARRFEAERRPFDCILMDLVMPRMDGFEATRTLRAQGLPVPIIALSADADNATATRAHEAGCDAHVAKPVDRKRLLDAIRRLCDAARDDSASI